MVGGREREHQFNGIYSNTLALWSFMPTECPQYSDIACGVIKTRLSKSLLRLFDIKSEASREREMRLSIHIDEEPGAEIDEAKIFVEVEGRIAIFTIQSAVKGEEEDKKRLRCLKVERRLGDRPEEVIQITKKDKFFKAFEEILNLGMRRKAGGVSLCGGCPAEENGLPRSVV